MNNNNRNTRLTVAVTLFLGSQVTNAANLDQINVKDTKLSTANIVAGDKINFDDILN
jgi:hypothetical protein